MRKITLLFLFMLSASLAFAQVGISENFDSGTPAGWTDTYSNVSTQSCDAGFSERENLYASNTTGNMTSPNQVGLSNGTDLTLSFDYKVVDWSAATAATDAGWGTAELQYSTDDGATWVTVLTVDDTNHVVANTCATMTTTVPGASLPMGSDVKVQVATTWADGDYYFYIDNFIATQVSSTPPNCDAVLTSPTNEAIDVSLMGDISWSTATGIPTGYNVTVGTSTGSSDVYTGTLGNVNTVNVGALTTNTQYFVNIVPTNDNGVATSGCVEYTFTTVDLPECPVVTGTPDAACGNFDSNLSWAAIAAADSYTVSVGTSAGATDIADNVDVGTALTYDFVSSAATTYYYTVNAINTAGTSSGCTEGSFTTFANGCYCDSDTTSVDGTGIGNLQVATTDFPSGGTLGYEDFTGAPVDLGQGVNANVVILFQTGFDYGVNIWIDFNDDFTFDTSEIVFTGVTESTNPTTFNASFVMPTDAALGTHRMRIVSDDTISQATDSCNSTTWHVTMDVDVNIIAVSCTAPVATATLVTDCANAQFSVDVDVTDLGSGTPAIFDGTTTTPITAVGLITVGPFADGAAVSLVIEHGSDTVCDLSLGSFTYTCPPSNDECSNPLPIVASEDGTCNESISGTTNNASISSDSCSTSGRDVWYSFTATVDGDYIIDATETFDSGFSSTYVTAYEGDCGSLTQIGNSTSCFNTADLTISTVAGNVYYINVRSSSSTGYVDFDLCVYPAPLPPANDECLDALPILASTDGTCNESVAGTTSGATTSSDSCSTTGRDVWYSFTSPTDGDYVVGVTETFESGFASTYVSTFEGDCGSLTQIGSSTTCFNTGNITISTIAGNVYYINVRSSSTTNYVDFDLCVFPAPLPPANDACIDATFIAGFNNGDAQDAFGATNNDGFIAETGCGSANDGVWYTFEVAIAGTINVDVTAVVGWDPEIIVLSGGCGTFTCVANADGGGTGGDESVSFVAEADTQYWVNVANWSGFTDNDEGPFAIDISSPDTAVLATSLDVQDFNRVSLFSYYPNPVNNTLTLNAQQAINNVSIFNMLGQEVIKSAPNAVSKAIDMSNLQSGAYFVKVTVGTTVETIRVIKN